MNLFSISLQYLRAKPLSNALNILVMGLGSAVIILLLLLSHQLEEKLTRNAKGIDLVVGAKGSPMQLILSGIFHIDYPTGNINLNEANEFARHRLVKWAIPLALGDSYGGFRIVGTNKRYAAHYGMALQSGRWWANTMEATIGAKVAEQTGLKLGDTFASAHGMGEATGDAHEGHRYQVAGIMQPSGSVLDNLILTNVESVWEVHAEHAQADDSTAHEAHDEHKAHEAHSHSPLPTDRVTGLPLADSTKELTVLLVKFRSPMGVVALPRYINSQTNMQAAAPGFEVNRLFSMLGVGVSVMQGFAYLIIVVAVLSIFIALYNALKERRYDLAVMRALGASPFRLFALVVLEGVLTTLAGGLLGIGLGHAATALLLRYAEAEGQVEPGQLTWQLWLPAEGYWLCASLLIGLVAALIPAIAAYRTDISKVLARG